MQRFALVLLFVVPAFVLAELVQATPVLATEVDNTLWWNDSAIVKTLSLTEEQRKKMGEYVEAYRDKVPKDRRPDAFHETLVQGDWKAARAENDKLTKLAETSVRMRGKLKIDVLSVLNVEQHKKFVDQYPRLIYKPWMRAMAGSSPR